MDGKHTPGPWKIREAGQGIATKMVASCGEWEVFADDVQRSRDQSDARLISAAPELLEALLKLRMQALQSPDLLNTKWGQEALDYAHAAIAKATGSAQ